MSDVDTVEKANQEQEAIEQVTTEQLVDAGAETAELSTQDNAEEVSEQIDLEDLAGEAKAQDDEQTKAHNAAMASKRRHMSKQIKRKEEQLNQLEQQLEKGVFPQGYELPQTEVGERPDLDSYKARLFEDFEGDTSLMLAYYNDDIRKYEEANKGIDAQRQAHINDLKASINQKRQADEHFVKKVEEFRAIVPNIEDGIDRFNDRIAAAHGANNVDNIADSLRNVVGDNAPLVLAAIGMNEEHYNGLIQASSGGDPAVIKFLTRLEDKLVSGLPSAKTISTAASETPVDGGGSGMSDIDAKMKAAADAGNTKEYQRLKAIKRSSAA